MKLSKYIVAALLAVLLPLTTQSESNSRTIVLNDDNTVILNDEVTGSSVDEVITRIKQLNSRKKAFGRENKDPIYLFLYTPGGSIQAGLELIEALKASSRPVNTITMFAASMGFQIAQNLGDRYILENGTLMSHHAAGGAEGQLGGKGNSQLQSRVGFWERRLKEMDEQTVRRTKGKQTLESYQEAYDHELWATGNESVAQGYADKVVLVQCDSSLNGVNTKHISIMGILNIDYDLDKCPLITQPKNVRISIETNKGTKDKKSFLDEGGSFGSSCLMQAGVNPTKLCALDTSLNIEKINEIENQFKDKHNNIQNHVVPMY